MQISKQTMHRMRVHILTPNPVKGDLNHTKRSRSLKLIMIFSHQRPQDHGPLRALPPLQPQDPVQDGGLRLQAQAHLLVGPRRGGELYL